MISIIKDRVPDLPSEPEYPVLKTYKDGDFIVLFKSAGCGTVVWSVGYETPKLGTWSEIWSESCFKPFNGEVVLSND